jgi:hypothetical protein
VSRSSRSIGVNQSSGLLGKYGTSHLRIENSRKAGRGAYRRVEAITRSTTQFLIEGHGLEGMVTKEDYKNVLDPFNAERDETMGLTTCSGSRRNSFSRRRSATPRP